MLPHRAPRPSPHTPPSAPLVSFFLPSLPLSSSGPSLRQPGQGFPCDLPLGCSPLTALSTPMSPWLPLLFPVLPPLFPGMAAPAAPSLPLGLLQADVCQPCRAGSVAPWGNLQSTSCYYSLGQNNQGRLRTAPRWIEAAQGRRKTESLLCNKALSFCSQRP